MPVNMQYACWARIEVETANGHLRLGWHALGLLQGRVHPAIFGRETRWSGTHSEMMVS